MHMDATAFRLMVEPGTHDLNVGCKLCIATCIAFIYTTPLPLGLATLTLRVVACNATLLWSQADTESQKKQLERAGHEPVCLVPGSVDKYLHVPESALQLRLDTQSEGFSLC